MVITYLDVHIVSTAFYATIFRFKETVLLKASTIQNDNHVQNIMMSCFSLEGEVLLDACGV